MRAEREEGRQAARSCIPRNIAAVTLTAPLGQHLQFTDPEPVFMKITGVTSKLSSMGLFHHGPGRAL